MNIEERNQTSRAASNFRNGLDLGMGTLYIVIGLVVLYIRHFGVVELPPTYAYILGGLMVLYGIFRVYRGIMGFRR